MHLSTGEPRVQREGKGKVSGSQSDGVASFSSWRVLQSERGRSMDEQPEDLLFANAVSTMKSTLAPSRDDTAGQGETGG